MDITKLSKKELDDLQKEIDKQKQTIKDEEIRKRKEISKKKLDKLREHKDFLLEIIDHDRTSCSDDNVCNGYGSASYGARCSKCRLIEVLNDDWDDEWEVDINVIITKIE